MPASGPADIGADNSTAGLAARLDRQSSAARMQGPGRSGPALNRRIRRLKPGPGAVAHHADGVELGLLAGLFLGPLAHLVALVEQLDLLELLERFAEVRLRLVELRRGARTPSA